MCVHVFVFGVCYWVKVKGLGLGLILCCVVSVWVWYVVFMSIL